MSDKQEFERAARGKDTGLWRETLGLVRHNKKWWLIPIIVALLLIGMVVVLSTTKAAPFIYSLF